MAQYIQHEYYYGARKPVYTNSCIRPIEHLKKLDKILSWALVAV